MAEGAAQPPPDAGILRRIAENAAAKALANAMASGTSGGMPPDLEARVATLEADMKDVKAILGRMEPVLAGLATKADLHKIAVDVAGIQGQMKTVPTLWQVGTTMLALNAGIVAVAALVVTLIRLS